MNNENTNYKNIASFSLNEKKEQNLISLIFLVIAGIGVGLIFFTKSYENNTLPPWKIILSIIGFSVLNTRIKYPPPIRFRIRMEKTPVLIPTENRSIRTSHVVISSH